MDLALFFNLIRGVALFAGVIGLIAGLDLVLGVRLIGKTKQVVDKVIDFDRTLIRVCSALRTKLDSKALDLDAAILNSPLRVVFGTALIILSVFILLFVRIQS
jgi:hypothetical protein